MKKNDFSAETLPAPTGSAEPDPHWGQGGSYRRDPETGRRTLVQRTEECADCNLKPKREG